MTLQAMVAVIERKEPKDPAARLVLLGLANHADRDGTGAWCAVSTLSLYSGLSERGVQENLRWLEANGFLTRGDRALALAKVKRADRLPTVYDLNLSPEARATIPKPPKADGRKRPLDGVRGVHPVESGSSEPTGCTGERPRGARGSGHGVHGVHPNQEQEPTTEPTTTAAGPAQPVDNAGEDGGGGRTDDEKLLAADQARLLLDPRLRGRSEKQREALRTALGRALEAGPWGTPLELAEAVNACLHSGEVRAPVGLLPSLIEAAREKHVPPAPQRRRREPCTTERNGHTWPGDGPCPMCREAGVA